MRKEEETEGCNGHDGKTGSKPVDAVDEVDGVDDEQRNENGEGITQPGGKFIKAEEAVKVVHIQPTKGQEERYKKLDEELQAGLEPEQVVKQPDEIDEKHTDEHDTYVHRERGEAPVVHQHLHHDGGGSSHQHGGHEQHASKPGDAPMVYLALIRQIVDAPPLAKPQQRPHQNGCQSETNDQRT